MYIFVNSLWGINIKKIIENKWCIVSPNYLFKHVMNSLDGVIKYEVIYSSCEIPFYGKTGQTKHIQNSCENTCKKGVILEIIHK